MKTKITIYIGIIFIFTGCTLFNPDLHYEPKTSKEYYFPSLCDDFKKAQADCIEQKKFPCNFPEPNDSISDFENTWYSKHLKSLKEPILYNKKNNGLRIIRYTNLGTWSNPYCYRIENNSGEIIGTYNKTSGLGGYKSGPRIEHKQKKLTYDNWTQIIAKIDSVDYWNIQTHDTNMVCDGAEWILEVLIDDKYHFVTRTSPNVYYGKRYVELCELVINSFER